MDVAIECVGLEASLNACARAVRRGGKIVQVGLHMKPAAIDAMLWAQKDISFEGCWCFRVQMWPRIMSMIEAGVFPVDKVVTTRSWPRTSSPRVSNACSIPGDRTSRFSCGSEDVRLTNASFRSRRGFAHRRSLLSAAPQREAARPPDLAQIADGHFSKNAHY